MIRQQLSTMTLRGLLLALVLGVACGPLGSMAADYQLVWSDEFSGAKGTSPDSSKWKFEKGNGDGGWGNGEKEYYTSDPSNVALDGSGHLVITARKITPDPSRQCAGGPCQYTSARMNTAGRFDFTYGKVDFRIQLPKGGKGIWPAAWLLGNNVGSVGWPACGEIDVLEMRGSQPNVATSALHGPGYSGGGALGARFDNKSPLPNAYHVFSVEWEPNKITLLVDGNAYKTHTPAELSAGSTWAFNGHPFFVIVNLAVGGGFDGDPNGSTTFPQEMKVDYVRVYQKE